VGDSKDDLLRIHSTHKVPIPHIRYAFPDRPLTGTDLQLALLKSADRDLEAFELRYGATTSISEVLQLVATARRGVRRLIVTAQRGQIKAID
jgi:hypothetical protein